ncbi:hypothetical protein FHS82_003701 [Pseudochelatococcus lubricantis]|uniref:Uncharacterized protein n=1 Tax=Pseudochelatococcus lubricantis TaxID=1538102 RepID=A0ABX0V5T8_9HYPH|nr:O-antigen ligase family protein [Pseudochelatococcus lubricantis]NIJ59840.1 hypothetical protein [Pseudochelatococcus lubricantis]
MTTSPPHPAGYRIFFRSPREARPAGTHTPILRGNAADLPTREHAGVVALILLAVLPFFGQSFHYMHQWPAPYFLSKAWPLLTLPLAIGGLASKRLPATGIMLVMFAYTVGLTPMLSMIHFGNGLDDALATTVKVLPFSYYFSLSFILLLLRPSPAAIARCMLGFGAATFVIMLLVWVLAPSEWYMPLEEQSKFLMYEIERGYRIYMPMFFGMLFLFYLARRFADRPGWISAVLIGVLFVLLVTIYKQRMAILSGFVIVVWGALPQRLRRVALSLGLLATAIAFLALVQTLEPLLGRAGESLGGSLSTRVRSFESAINYIGDSATNWLFGLGAVTRLSRVTLEDILGSANFYLADLGWLGIVFEYGLVGALLISAVYGMAFLITYRTASATGTPFAKALNDYILFMILASPIYPLVFVPGEMATVLAVSVYIAAYAQPEIRTFSGIARRMDAPSGSA